MKKNILAITALSALTGTSVLFISLHGGGLLKEFKLSADSMGDYSLVFDKNNNLLDSASSSSSVSLGGGNHIDIFHNGYALANDKWGALTPDGYFNNEQRVGGMTNISYSIDGDLKIYYGYSEYDKPTFYNATLYSSFNSFNFLEERGYPDVFKIVNESGSLVNIERMSFFYTCSQFDEHVHTSTSGNIDAHEVGGDLVYSHHCDICNQYYDNVDVSMYKVKLGSGYDTTGAVEYNPYTVRDYSGLGTLSFDANNKEFILEVSGDHTGQNLFVDANVDGSTTYTPRLLIRSSNNAIVHDITQRGGYGILIFEGNLTLHEGRLETEASINTIRGNMHFDDTRLSKDYGISLLNGQLYVENNATVTINGFKTAIAALGNATNGGIWFTNGALNISNCNRGIVSNISADWSSGDHDRYIRLNCNTSIVTSEYAIRMVDGTYKADQLLLDSNGTYYFEATNANATALSVTNVQIGSTSTSPNVTIKTNGGTAISDGGQSDNINIDFISGTTTIIDNANSGSSATNSFGIRCQNSSNVINVYSNATLNVQDFKYGFHGSRVVSLINVLGHLNINGCFAGIHELSLAVGDNNNAGSLLINVNAGKGASGIGNRSYGISQNQYESMAFNNGQAVIMSSSSSSNTSAIWLTGGFSNSRVTVSSGFKLGFKKIDRPFDLEYSDGSPYYGSYDFKEPIHCFSTGDKAWYSGNKPNSIDYNSESDFNAVFGL